jgi:hypothetical protein
MNAIYQIEILDRNKAGVWQEYNIVVNSDKTDANFKKFRTYERYIIN